MSVDFNVEELKRSILNQPEVGIKLETKLRAREISVKDIIKTRLAMKRRPSKFIRVCAWLDDRTSDCSEEDYWNDGQSDVVKESVPRRRARRIRMNWGTDEDNGEDNGNKAEGTHGPVITTFSSKGRRLLMK